MTKMEMAILGKEFDKNYYSKYHIRVTETYKYRGVVKTRETLKMTEEGEKILDILDGEKLFRCPCCGEMKSFLGLEVWDEDTVESIVADEVTCSLCYEEEMGEDL